MQVIIKNTAKYVIEIIITPVSVDIKIKIKIKIIIITIMMINVVSAKSQDTVNHHVTIEIKIKVGMPQTTATTIFEHPAGVEYFFALIVNNNIKQKHLDE